MAGSGVLSLRPGTAALLARGHWPLAAVLALATALFSFRLGSSSLFLDEVYTWYTVRGDLGELGSRLVEQEVTPPLYYLVLDGWVALTGADSETALRLPSVLAGVALVSAIYWLGSLLGGRMAGVVGAGLAAVSPLVLLYAQQTRSYVWAMLAVTIAVAAAIEGVRARSPGWLATAAAAGAAAILTHYTAVLVVIPLAGWLLLQEDAFRLRTRVLAVAALALPLLALTPLIAEQLSRGHQDWTEQFGRLGVENTLRLLGTPFDGRFDGVSTLVRQVGAAVVIAAAALLALADRLGRVRERRLVATAALAPIAGVLLTSAFVHPVALTRYTAIAAPFVLVAIGVVAVHVQRTLAVVVVGAALGVSAVGVAGAERPEGQYPDARAAVATMADHWRGSDIVVGVNLFVFPDALAYYAERGLPAGGPKIQSHATAAAAAEAPEIVEAARRGRRIWLLADPPLSASEAAGALGRLGYRTRRQWRYAGPRGIQLVLASSTAAVRGSAPAD